MLRLKNVSTLSYFFSASVIWFLFFAAIKLLFEFAFAKGSYDIYFEFFSSTNIRQNYKPFWVCLLGPEEIV